MTKKYKAYLVTPVPLEVPLPRPDSNKHPHEPDMGLPPFTWLLKFCMCEELWHWV